MAAPLGCSLAAILFFIGCNFNAPKPAPANPAVPDKIKVLPNRSPQIRCPHTKDNVQIYECDTIAPGKYGWVFKAPEADLYDESEKKISTHYKSTGATWSRVSLGIRRWQPRDRQKNGGRESAAGGTDAIPWLLLEGSNRFVGITKIQRVNTVGGKAPEGECDAASVGKQVRVDYSATYYFYTAK